MSIEIVQSDSKCSPLKPITTQVDEIPDDNNSDSILSDNLLAFELEIKRAKDEIDERENCKKKLWEKYCDLCFPYHLSPISEMKKVFDGSKQTLDLSCYIPRSIEIQLACKALLGPPLSQLTEMDFSYSPFYGNGCAELAQFIEESATLKTLNLNHCGIGLSGAEILKSALFYSESLKYLNLSHCKLNDVAGAIVAKALISNEVCEVVDLSYNELGMESGTGFGMLLGSNSTLNEVELKWNKLFPADDAVVPLLTGLGKNTNLKRLGLAWNGLMGEAFEIALKKALIKNRTLQELDIQHNLLSSTGAQTLSSILPTSNLKRLFIGGNLFNENDVKSLVSSLMRNSSLQIFSLGTETWLTNDIAEIVKKVMEQHNNLCVLYKGVRMPDTRTVDFSAILVDRCKFLAMKPKKPKLQRNMGDFFYKKLRDGPEYCLPADFLILVQEFKAKLDDELVQQIADHWTVLVGKSKKVNVKELCNYYLARYPYELIEEPIKPEKVPAASADKEVVNKGKKKKKK